MIDDDGGAHALATLLDKSFREVAFFNRVALADLALVYPEAFLCRTKAAFIRPYLETLRALIHLGLREVPAEVGRLASEYPDVARLLSHPAARSEAEPARTTGRRR